MVLITRGLWDVIISKDELFIKSSKRNMMSGCWNTLFLLATGLVIDLSYKEASDFANQAAGIWSGIGTSAITTDELINFD